MSLARQLSCPSCGAPQTIANPGVVVAVCDRCDSLIYDEEGVARAGVKARLAPTTSALVVGATLQLRGASLTLVGRVVWTHDQGRWTEWAARDGARWRWLVEDQGELTLEQPLQGRPPPVELNSPLGTPFHLNARRYLVTERGEARCEGAEGELPRAAPVGQTQRYVDLASPGGWRLLVEFIEGQPPAFFTGRLVESEGIRPPAGAGPAPPLPQEARRVACAKCGAPLQLLPAGQPTRTVACRSCSSVLELAGLESKVVGVNASAPAFAHALGERLLRGGRSLEVVGRLALRDGGELVQEYLLWEPAGSAWAWLEVHAEGRYLWRSARELSGTIDPRALIEDQRLQVEGRDWVVEELGQSRLIYVDGALYWEARVGETLRYAELRAVADPRERLCAEWSGVEVEWVRGRRDAPPPSASASEDLRVNRVDGGLCALVAAVALLLGGALWFPVDPLWSISMEASTTLEGEAFEVQRGGFSCLQLRHSGSGLWVGADVELWRDEDDAYAGLASLGADYLAGDDEDTGKAEICGYLPAGRWRLEAEAEAEPRVQQRLSLTLEEPHLRGGPLMAFGFLVGLLAANLLQPDSGRRLSVERRTLWIALGLLGLLTGGMVLTSQPYGPLFEGVDLKEGGPTSGRTHGSSGIHAGK